jgi:hypothetical protein
MVWILYEPKLSTILDVNSNAWRPSFGSPSSFLDLRPFPLIRRQSLGQLVGQCLTLDTLAARTRFCRLCHDPVGSHFVFLWVLREAGMHHRKLSQALNTQGASMTVQARFAGLRGIGTYCEVPALLSRGAACAETIRLPAVAPGVLVPW